jgi:hypothetical protein
MAIHPSVCLPGQQWWLDRMVSTHAGARVFKTLAEAAEAMVTTADAYADYTEMRVEQGWA